MYFHMRKSRTQAVISLALLLAWCACAFALDPSLDVSQYAHTVWRVRDGFSKGVITSLAQTPDGYLWVGTESGLLRFDGVRTLEWNAPVGQHLPGTLITYLVAAHDATLWIGTFNGLASWRDGKLTQFPELGGRNVQSLLETRDGTLWVGIYGDPGEGRLCDIRKDVLHCEKVPSGIRALYQDEKGALWVGVQNGFWRWTPGREEFFSVPNDPIGITSFAQDETGQLFVGSSSGIHRLVDGRVESYPSPAPLYHWQVERMFRDHNGGIWVATAEHGLVHIHEKGKRADVFTHIDGLSGDYVTNFLEDREGNIWVSTFDGIDRFREYAIPTVSTQQGLSNTAAWSVLAAKDGAVWIATNGGLNYWKDGEIRVFGSDVGRQKSSGKVDGSPPISLFQDSSGRLWVSNIKGEVGYLENQRFVPIPGVRGGTVYSIAEVPKGHIWVANQPQGQLWIRDKEAALFHWFNGRVLESFPWAELARNDFAKVIIADPSQRGLWLGFRQGGVAYFEGGQIRQSYSVENGLGDGRITDLRFGTRGALWVSTSNGLSRIKEGHITTLTSKNGLPCNQVVATMEDNDHSMWLNLACGVARITQAELDAWVANPHRLVSVQFFDTYDGARTHSAAGGYSPLMAKSADGKIWFLPWDGVSVIDPHHLPFNSIPPPVHVEKVIADDKTYPLSDGVQLPAGVRHLDIDYTALSLVVPEKVRFRVKLEGQDKDWRELVNVRHVEYTNLPPKHYKFRVLACNNSGVWNEEGATLEFVIPPAWYQTNWFYALCAAAFLASLWAAHLLRVRQLTHEFNMGLEQRVAERTRIARELHDTLLQSFQALLPLLQAGINMFGSRPADALRTFEKAADHASQAIAEGRDAIQGMRMSTVEKNDLAVAIRTLGEELASAATQPSSPNFNVVVEGTSRNLHPILRDEVYRLTTEALRNAFRHAAAQNVEVEIRYDEKYFRLRIRDDGKGIPSDVLSGDGREGHYGLPGMRERAKLIGGKLTIWTEVDGGTEIELNIPGARAFVKSARPFWYFGKRAATETDEKEPIERE